MSDLLDLVNAMEWGAAQELVEGDSNLINYRGPDGQSPVQEAIYRGGKSFATYLASKGRQLDQFEATVLALETPLKTLLDTSQEGIDARSYDGWTALHLAGFVGAASCAKVLITAGASVQAQSDNAMQNTPLAACLAGSGSLDIARLLIDAGANVNATGAGGFSPIHLAASRGAEDAITLLLNSGALLSAADNGQTPADIAVERDFPEAAALLAGR